MGAINRYNFLRWDNKGLTSSPDGGVLYKLSNVFETDTENNNQYEPTNIDFYLFEGATLDQESGKSRITAPDLGTPPNTVIKFLETNVTAGNITLNRKLVIKIKVNEGRFQFRFKQSGISSRTLGMASGGSEGIIFDEGFYKLEIDSNLNYIITLFFNIGQTLDYMYFTYDPLNSPSYAEMVIHDIELLNLDFVPVTADFDEVQLLPKYNPKARGCMSPIMVPGEQTAFYLNTAIGITEDLVLHLINANTLASIVSIGTVSKIEFAEGYHFYHTFINPVVASGYYKLGLFQGSELALVSNDVFVMTSKYNELSMRFKFRHNSNMFGFNYDRVPTFYQQFRLPIIESEHQINYDIDQYKSSTSKKTRNYYASTERYRKFDAQYFDELAHEAAGVMVEHDLLYINEQKYTFKQGYKINDDPISRVSKGEFELFEDKFINDKYAQLTIIS